LDLLSPEPSPARPFEVMIDPTSSNVPKDADLVDLFRSHRDAFERLATMAIEDTDTFSSISVETQNKEL
jgi:hypothetical protein